MPFLTRNDLTTATSEDLLLALEGQDTSLVTDMIAEQMAILASYLQGSYDTKTLFEMTGDDRPTVVLKYLKDLVLYELYMRQARTVPPVARQRYQDAIIWLEKVSAGHLSPDLPRKTEDALKNPSRSTSWRTGSKPKKRSDF